MTIDEMLGELNQIRKDNGNLHVYFNDGENGATRVAELNVTDSYSPSGIPFLMIDKKS